MFRILTDPFVVKLAADLREALLFFLLGAFIREAASGIFDGGK